MALARSRIERLARGAPIVRFAPGLQGMPTLPDGGRNGDGGALPDPAALWGAFQIRTIQAQGRCAVADYWPRRCMAAAPAAAARVATVP